MERRQRKLYMSVENTPRHYEPLYNYNPVNIRNQTQVPHLGLTPYKTVTNRTHFLTVTVTNSY